MITLRAALVGASALQLPGRLSPPTCLDDICIARLRCIALPGPRLFVAVADVDGSGCMYICTFVRVTMRAVVWQRIKHLEQEAKIIRN